MVHLRSNLDDAAKKLVRVGKIAKCKMGQVANNFYFNCLRFFHFQMVRHYKKKTNRCTTPTNIMQKAIDDVLINGLCIPDAAKKHEIGYYKLRRYLKKFQLDNKTSLAPSYNFSTVFSKSQEEELVEYLLECSKMSYGFTSKNARILAYQLAVKKQLQIPPTRHANETAGLEWFRQFMKRHPELSMRTPQNVSMSRAISFNQHTAKMFFDNLKRILEKYPCFADGTRI